MWGNYLNALRLYPAQDWFLNSLVIAVVGCVLTSFLDLSAAYAFSKFRFRGRNVLFAVLISTLVIPTQVLLVPQFLIIAGMRGLDTYWAVILPRAAEAYGVFLAIQFFEALPDELLEAARLDGASEWSIFWRIVVPLSKPVIAVLLLVNFLGRWNDFAWPLVVLKGKHALTLPVGLNLLKGEYATDWTSIMAVSIVAIVPVLLLFVALQRYFVQGITRSGIK